MIYVTANDGPGNIVDVLDTLPRSLQFVMSSLSGCNSDTHPRVLSASASNFPRLFSGIFGFDSRRLCILQTLSQSSLLADRLNCHYGNGIIDSITLLKHYSKVFVSQIVRG
jgi:hypothetical protein